MLNQETQPGLPEVHAPPALSEEDAQLAAMGWAIPKTCRPSQPATPKVLQQPAPATAVGQAAATGGLPAPGMIFQQVNSAPATASKDGVGALQQVSGQRGVPVPVGSGHTGAPAPATAPGGLRAPATVPHGQADGVPAHGPAPATVPQQVHGQAGGVPAHGPAPATVPQQVHGQAGGVPATVPQRVQAPAPATAVPMAGTVLAPATVSQAVAGLPPPATVSPPLATAVPRAAQQQVQSHVPATPAVAKVGMPPPPVPQGQVGVAAPATHASKSGMPQPNKDEYSRRAAANLIKRLKENPSRVEGMPSLKNMLSDENKKSDLISLLVDNQGNLSQVQTFLQVQEDVGRVQIARKKALRFTKKEMQYKYGEDAERVMKFKENQKLTDEDENNPNGKVYLISSTEDETENYQRNCILDALMHACMPHEKPWSKLQAKLIHL